MRVDTTLSKYVWEVKRKLKIMPSLKWYIIKSVPAYSNISKKCQLCLQEKFEILNYPNPNELLNKRSELISKCHHVNKFLMYIHSGVGIDKNYIFYNFKFHVFLRSSGE